ncbi:MAG: hypothetical protein U0Z44_13575 [Kouleothrix sp.]
MRELSASFTILAVETSCDETAAAIVRGGQVIVANVVASQIDIHRRYGGVVPEVAARQHILALPAVIEAARRSCRADGSMSMRSQPRTALAYRAHC